MQTVRSKDGTRIAYDKRGVGPALIFVGGAFQYRSFDVATAHFATLLSDQFTTYHYDRRGRGDSTDVHPYDTQREIEDLAALIEEAGGSAYVFGMSSGAVLALDAAAAGLSIKKLVTYEPPLIVDSTRQPVPDDYVQHLQTLIAQGKPSEAVAYAMTAAMGASEQDVAGMRQSPVWGAFEAVAHTIAYDGAFVADVMAGRPLPANRWQNAALPVLVVDGGNSPEWIRNGAAALAAVLPYARRQTVPGQTHAFDPEVLRPIVQSFFTS